MNFVKALLSEIKNWKGDPAYLTTSLLAEMLERAATASVGNAPSPISIHRQIDPEDGKVWHVLKIEGNYTDVLDAGYVATLRAILMIYDEYRPAQIGEPLTVPALLEGGQIVTTWTGTKRRAA